MKNKKNACLTAAVVLLFLFLRFYHLPQRVIFDWDQEQFTTQARDIILDHKFTLLGPRVTDDQGFFLAPYLTYMFVPFLFLTGTHPSALIPFVVVITIIFVSITLYTLPKLVRFRQTLFFILLWTINPFLIFFDVVPWWPILIPTGVILTWLFLYILYKNNRLIYQILLGVTLGFFMNMHFQFVFVTLFAAIMLVLFYIQKKITRSTFVVVTISAGVMFLPLLLFDIRHNFLNTKLFTDYFSNRIGRNDHFQYFAWVPVMANTFDSITVVNHTIAILLFYGSFIFSQWHFSKKSTGFMKDFYTSGFLLSILTIVGFSIYGRRPSEYYFIFIYPFIILSIIRAFMSTPTIRYMVIVLLLLTAFQLPRIQKAISPNSYGLYYKNQVIKKISQYNNKQIHIDFKLPIGGYTGYDYLLRYYDIKDSEATSAAQIIVCDPALQTDLKIGGLGLGIPKELSKD